MMAIPCFRIYASLSLDVKLDIFLDIHAGIKVTGDPGGFDSDQMGTCM